jgi:hypothetical protein
MLPNICNTGGFSCAGSCCEAILGGMMVAQERRTSDNGNYQDSFMMLPVRPVSTTPLP